MNKLTKKITYLLLEEINKDYIIYFDIDDTLTNYSENLSTVMVNDKETNEKRPIKASDTANNLDFWLNAKSLPGVKEMVKFAQNNFNQVKILSAVPELSKAKKEETGERFYEAPIKGKTEWLNKNIGPIEKIWVKSGKEKDVYAKPNTVLVDDKMDNIKYFEQAGGIGILFDNAQNVINKLKQLKSPITESTTYSGNIDYKQQIKDLTRFYLKKYPNLKQLPKVIFKNGDVENAKDFFGKTAYYDPNTKTIVLYTEGRHPRDITSSFCHEFIHFIQDIEERLHMINTQNVLEDSELEKLEREAYEKGGIMLRAYKDFMNNIEKERYWVGKLLYESLKESQVNFNELEKYLDTIFEEYGIDVSFSKHFKERVLERGITEEDIIELSDKILQKYGDEVADLNKGENRVFTHLRKLVDIAVVNNGYNDDYLKDLIFKTAYKRNNPREPEFKTNSTAPKLKVTEGNKDPFGLNQFARELAQGLEEEETPNDYIIYSDMDGVICDFDKRFAQFSGGVSGTEYEKLNGVEKFWELIDNKIGVRFWVGIPWTEGGQKYWNYIKKYNPTLLSAPSRNNESRLGKKLWIKKHIPGTKVILTPAWMKKEYAKSNAILIDDLPKNIQQWRDAGGIGILYVNADDTISKLKELGL